MKELSPEQVAKMRPEARERYEQRLKTVKRNRKILGISCSVIGLIVVVLVLSITVLFNISSIKVGKTGDIYTADQIIMASGLNIGDNMVRTNFNKVEERIERSLPYIKDAVVTTSISGKVVITVKDTSAAMVIHTENGFAITDADSKVLEMVQTLPEDNTLMVLKVSGGATVAVGEKLVLSDIEEESLYNELIGYLRTAGLFEHITEMDLSDKLSLKLIYANRIRLMLGSADGLEDKVKSAEKVLAQENEQNPELIAEINLSIPKKVFVNPVESLYPQEEETTVTDENAETDETTQNDEIDGDNQEEITDTQGGQAQGENNENNEETTSQDEPTQINE